MNYSDISISDFHAEVEHYITGPIVEISMISGAMVILMGAIKKGVCEEDEAREVLADSTDLDLLGKELGTITPTTKKELIRQVNEIIMLMEDKFNEIIFKRSTKS